MDELPEFECPRCQSTDYSTWQFPHPLILHWVLNPGLVVNELILGQRIPYTTFYCQRCGSNTTSLRFYQCPGCGGFHQELIWTGSNGFGHWLGLICPDCGDEIPCLTNFATWFVLARLSPFNWVLRRMFARRYSAWERQRAWRHRARLEREDHGTEPLVAVLQRLRGHDDMKDPEQDEPDDC